MRYLPILCSLAIPVMVNAVTFYHPPDRIPERDPSINPFDRRMVANNPDSALQYTCPCTGQGLGRRAEGRAGVADIADAHDAGTNAYDKRMNPQQGVNALPDIQQPAVPPPPANTCLCAPAVPQQPPAVQSPAVPQSPVAPVAPNQVSYVTVHSTIVSYTTITQQPPVHQPLQTIYMTHKVTSLVKGLQSTDHGAAGSPTAKVSSEESPAVSIQASTDADQDSEASATSTTTTTTADATLTPSSSVKIILKVDALIDVYSEKTVGLVGMKILPHDVELPALNKDNKEIALRFMWIDDPNATNPLGIANDVSFVCLITRGLTAVSTLLIISASLSSKVKKTRR